MQIDYDPDDPLGLLPQSRRPATLTPEGRDVDAAEVAKDLIDANLPTITQAVIDHALGRIVLTREQLLAAENIMKRGVPLAATQSNITQTVEIRDRRREIDALVEVLLQPGAVQRTDEGAALVRLEPEPRDSSAARADGAGPPEGVDIDQLP